MGAILERSTITVAHCIEYARLNVKADNPTGDLIFELALRAVKELADHVCDNKFIKENSDGEPELDANGNEQELPIPAIVEMWILRKFARWAEYRLSGNNEVTLADVGSIKLDKRDWSELTPAMDVRNK